MNYCTMCKEPAIYSRPLPISIAKVVYFCPMHFAGLIIGQVFANSGIELNDSIEASKNLVDLVKLQHLGLWNEEFAASVELGPTLDTIQKATSPKDIIGGT